MKTFAKFSLLSLALVCALIHAATVPARAQRARGKTAGTAAGKPAPPQIAARPVADTLAPAGWTRYEIGQPTRFSLILPAAPTTSAERMTLTSKITVTVRNYMSLGASGLYGATYIDDLPQELMNDAMKQTFFEYFVKGFAEGFQEGMKKGGSTGQIRMVAQRATTSGGLSGYEQDFTFDAMTGRIRLFYDGARAYGVLSISTDPASDADRMAFFDSLRVNRGR